MLTAWSLGLHKDKNFVLIMFRSKRLLIIAKLTFKTLPSPFCFSINFNMRVTVIESKIAKCIHFESYTKNDMVFRLTFSPC